MTEQEQKIVDALKGRFIRTIEEGRGTSFKDSKVELPKDDVWLSYARAVIEIL